MPKPSLKTVALAGGVGGAKLAHGLAQCLPPENLTVIVNVGDDFEHMGLRICPDLDTVCYTLGGIANPATGWGLANESWNTFEGIKTLGGPTWFQLGDRDIATHLERTRRLAEGQPLSQITRDFCRAWGVELTVLPTTDDFIPTWVYTDNGELPFQEYFVHQQCQPRVTGFHFEGAERARPAPGVLEALDSADLIVFCPSNPWVSIDPILAIPGIREAIAPHLGDGGTKDQGKRERPVLAMSPIIGGKTVKGPAAKMYAELGIQPSALAVARHYRPLLTAFVLDIQDAEQADAIQALGIRTLTTNTLMVSPEERRRLALETLDFGSL
jgi:LPPG:FO 2-phospho-L-lactate transferase